MSEQFLEILFVDEVQPDDLEFIRLASREQPGRARLGKARVGEPRPKAPGSRPVHSHVGPLFGFMAQVDLMEPPYTYTYIIEEAERCGDTPDVDQRRAGENAVTTPRARA